MAIQFATELRAAAKQAGNVGERSLSDLRDLLTDTLAKVRDEVFAERKDDKPADGTGRARVEVGRVRAAAIGRGAPTFPAPSGC